VGDYLSPLPGFGLNSHRRIRDWVSAKPNAITARVALAFMLADDAWMARGGDWGTNTRMARLTVMVQESQCHCQASRPGRHSLTVIEEEGLGMKAGIPEAICFPHEA